MKTISKLLAGGACALLVITATPGLAIADSRSGPVVNCSTGQQVGAYSRADGATWQQHTYYSTSGGEQWFESYSYIHASDSMYQSASTLWEATSIINVWSNRCA